VISLRCKSGKARRDPFVLVDLHGLGAATSLWDAGSLKGIIRQRKDRGY